MTGLPLFRYTVLDLTLHRGAVVPPDADAGPGYRYGS